MTNTPKSSRAARARATRYGRRAAAWLAGWLVLSALAPSAVAENAQAIYDRAIRYYYGNGVATDKRRGCELFRAAAEAGHATGAYGVGWCYRAGDFGAVDKARAIRWIRLGAQRGDLIAMDALGRSYLRGRGVAKDPRAAIVWLRRSAQGGWKNGQNSYGYAFLHGLGVKRDYAQAMYWFRKAAAQQHPKAMFNIARLYETGRGVAKDVRRAARWYKTAHVHGHRGAVKRLHAMGIGLDEVEPLPGFETEEGEPTEGVARGVRDCGPRGTPVWHGNVQSCKCDAGFMLLPELEHYGCVRQPRFQPGNNKIFGTIPGDDPGRRGSGTPMGQPDR